MTHSFSLDNSSRMGPQSTQDGKHYALVNVVLQFVGRALAWPKAMNNQRQPPKVGDVSHALERFVQLRFWNSLHLGAIFGRIFAVIRSFTSLSYVILPDESQRVSSFCCFTPPPVSIFQPKKQALFHYPTIRPSSTGSLFGFPPGSGPESPSRGRALWAVSWTSWRAAPAPCCEKQAVDFGGSSHDWWKNQWCLLVYKKPQENLFHKL